MNNILRPQPGPQTAFAAADTTIAFYGGEPTRATFHRKVSKETPLIAGNSLWDNQQPSQG